MEDIQLAMVIARLFESEFETSSTYISILNQKILGCQKDGTGFDCKRLHPDPFLRSLAYWVVKDYTRALDTLLEQTPKEDDEQQGRFLWVSKYLLKNKTKVIGERLVCHHPSCRSIDF
jgi:hypothetical protein